MFTAFEGTMERDDDFHQGYLYCCSPQQITYMVTDSYTMGAIERLRLTFVLCTYYSPAGYYDSLLHC